MKKYFCLVVAGAACVAHCEDAVAPVVSSAGDAGILTGTILQAVLGVAGTGITALIVWIMKRWLNKLGIDRIQGIDALIEGAVERGVHYAEGWAAKQASKPPSSEKMAKVILFVKAALGNSIVQEYGEAKLTLFVESILSREKNKGDMPVSGK